MNDPIGKDFSIEAWMSRAGVPSSAKAVPIVSTKPVDAEEWLSITLSRDGPIKTWVHDDEMIDGVLYVRATLYEGPDSQMIERRLTRADRMKG